MRPFVEKIRRSGRAGALLLLCVVVSFSTWLLIMYHNDAMCEYTDHEVAVETVNGDSLKAAGYQVSFSPTVSVPMRGTGVDLANCKASQIHAVVDLSSLRESGRYPIAVTYRFDEAVTLTPIETVYVEVVVSNGD